MTAPIPDPGQRLLGELLTRGTVVVPVTRIGAAWVVGGLSAAAASVALLGALGVVLVLTQEGGIGAALAVAAATALLLAVTVVALVLVRRGGHRPVGQWVLDARGVTVDGVGPVPWGDLLPPEHRMESAPRDDGYRRVLVMPLTEAGQQRALGLAPAQRRVLNEAVRPTVWGPRPLQTLLVRPTPELSREELGAVLEQARQAALAGRVPVPR